MTDWITHRQPTAADADGDGDVFVPRDYPPAETEQYVPYQYVGSGIPWKHSDCYRGNPPIEPSATPASPPVVRTFRSISRTVTTRGTTTIDAIADDGTAWWRTEGEQGWWAHPPLPQPDQPGD